MPSFSVSSYSKLMTADIRLQRIMLEVIKYIDFTVIEAHRGKEAQDEAFRTGHSKLPWPKGKHNAYPSKALDIVPYFKDARVKINWKDIPAMARLMGYVQRVADEQGVKLRFGLDWDGDFQTVSFDDNEFFLDAPHVELVED